MDWKIAIIIGKSTTAHNNLSCGDTNINGPLPTVRCIGMCMSLLIKLTFVPNCNNRHYSTFRNTISDSFCIKCNGYITVFYSADNNVRRKNREFSMKLGWKRKQNDESTEIYALAHLIHIHDSDWFDKRVQMNVLITRLTSARSLWLHHQFKFEMRRNNYFRFKTLIA